MSRPVAVVGYCFDVVVYVGVKMLSTLAVINATRYNMPHVWNYAGADKQLTFGIIVNSPGIAEAMGNYFKFIFGWMIPPNASVDIGAFAFKNMLRKGIFVFIQPALSFWLSYF